MIGVVVTVAAFVPSRYARGLSIAAELTKQGPVRVSSSRVKESPAEWWPRAMAAVVDMERDNPKLTATVVVQDDVEIAPHLLDHVEHVLRAADSRVVSLHTSLPSAEQLLGLGMRFARSWWVTGPAYVLRRGVAKQLLVLFNRLHHAMRKDMKEDNLVQLWCWMQREPAWSTIPAMVVHDLQEPSVYEHRPQGWRTASVPFTKFPVGRPEEYWRAHPANVAPPLLACPWFSEQWFRKLEISVALGIDHMTCHACLESRSALFANDSALQVCAACAAKLGEGAGEVMRRREVTHGDAERAASERLRSDMDEMAKPYMSEVTS